MASCDHDDLPPAEYLTGPAVVIHNHVDVHQVLRMLAHLIRDVHRMEQLIMATKDELNQRLDNLGHDQERVLGEVAGLRTTVDELRVLIEQQADMSEQIAKVDQLDAALEAISPEPAEPEPTPEPTEPPVENTP